MFGFGSEAPSLVKSWKDAQKVVADKAVLGAALPKSFEGKLKDVEKLLKAKNPDFAKVKSVLRPLWQDMLKFAADLPSTEQKLMKRIKELSGILKNIDVGLEDSAKKFEGATPEVVAATAEVVRLNAMMNAKLDKMMKISVKLAAAAQNTRNFDKLREEVGKFKTADDEFDKVAVAFQKASAKLMNLHEKGS